MHAGGGKREGRWEKYTIPTLPLGPLVAETTIQVIALGLQGVNQGRLEKRPDLDKRRLGRFKLGRDFKTKNMFRFLAPGRKLQLSQRFIKASVDANAARVADGHLLAGVVELAAIAVFIDVSS